MPRCNLFDYCPVVSSSLNKERVGDVFYDGHTLFVAPLCNFWGSTIADVHICPTIGETLLPHLGRT